MYLARRPWRVTLLAGCVVVVAVGATVSAAAEATQERRGAKWWQDARYKHELNLTVEQSTRLEEIFQASVPRFRELKQELDVAEKSLSRMISEATVDETTVAQQVDRVEAARSALGKARMLMLYRMHRVLTVDQRERLKKATRDYERRSPRF